MNGIRWWSCGFFSATFGVALNANAALLVDDFEAGSQANALGGTYSTLADASSAVGPRSAAIGHGSVNAVTWSYALGSGTTYPWALLATNLRSDASTAGIDVSQYAGVRFWVKGSGQYVCQLPNAQTAAEYNHFQAAFSVSPDWSLVELPFVSFAQTWGAATAWDKTSVWAIQWLAQGAAGTSGELTIDDVEFYGANESTAATPVVLVEPKANQIGYLPEATKIFRVTSPNASTGDAFSIVGADGSVVLAGELAPDALDDSASTGESVLSGDFSALTKPGRYSIDVAGQSSIGFEVAANVYDNLYRDALRAFSLIRCGVAVDDAESGLAHAACHTNDAALRADPAADVGLTGGWHNAGDFGKWVHMAAISAGYMMTLHDLGGAAARAIDAGIPESGDSTSDLLDEARWGIEWILKMQRPDGSVLHKVDSEPNFAWGQAPQNDPNVRFASSASSLDAAVFVAASAHAARDFSSVDPEFAERCRTAAQLSWDWLRANPGVVHDDPYYRDIDPSQELLWAKAEWALVTEDLELMAELATTLDSASPGEVSWMAPQLLGVAALAANDRTEPALRLAATSYVDRLAEGIASKATTSGYGVALTASEYYWGSNEIVLHRAAALLMADDVLGGTRYRGAALQQLDYLLGTNSLNLSFVTGYGTRRVEQPYHWSYFPLNTAIPGWVSGGPNSHVAGADPPLVALIEKGTPPAKCFLDMGGPSGSWASNEGQTTENAALLFVSGHFVSEPREDTEPAPAATSATGGGCACRTVSGSRRPGSAAILALAALVLGSRRRRQ